MVKWSWSWSRSQKKEKVEPEPEPKLNNFSSPSLVQRAVQLIEVILPFSAQCYSASFFSVCFIIQLEVILNCVIQVAVIQRDLFRIFAFLPWLFLRCLTLYCCFYSYYYFFIIFCQLLFAKFYSAYRIFIYYLPPRICYQRATTGYLVQLSRRRPERQTAASLQEWIRQQLLLPPPRGPGSRKLQFMQHIHRVITSRGSKHCRLL